MNDELVEASLVSLPQTFPTASLKGEYENSLMPLVTRMPLETGDLHRLGSKMDM